MNVWLGTGTRGWGQGHTKKASVPFPHIAYSLSYSHIFKNLKREEEQRRSAVLPPFHVPIPFLYSENYAYFLIGSSFAVKCLSTGGCHKIL
jgi:hypothetical protein